MVAVDGLQSALLIKSADVDAKTLTLAELTLLSLVTWSYRNLSLALRSALPSYKRTTNANL